MIIIDAIKGIEKTINSTVKFFNNIEKGCVAVTKPFQRIANGIATIANLLEREEKLRKRHTKLAIAGVAVGGGVGACSLQSKRVMGAVLGSIAGGLFGYTASKFVFPRPCN